MFYYIFFINNDYDKLLLVHPYPVAALISSIAIVLSFKLSASYNRWWEACADIHNMHAKWTALASTTAAFHLQSKVYDSVAPPAFGDHQDVNFDFVRRRENTERAIFVTARETLRGSEPLPSGKSNKLGKALTNKLKWKSKDEKYMYSINSSASTTRLPFPNDYWTRTKSQSNGIVSNTSTKEEKALASKPSLFLQETAHLVSLLSAVALSTLRYDAEGEEAPLTDFVPGMSWPSKNSDDDQEELRRNGYQGNKFVLTLKFLFDVSRSPQEILDYNAARPFPVIGGISDKEAELLRNARGSSAKMALVYLWLNEFITREHLHGSMGTVGAPIISRLMQYVSDGHMWYNSARKTAYIPFPFPHIQLTTAFTYVVVLVVPLLMLSKSNFYFGIVLNFLVVGVLAGLNEVAKELQNPFTNVPNDLPLNLFQAHFNEALVTIFAGYHPDAWWELKENA